MEHGTFKKGDKVKFNGKTFEDGYHHALTVTNTVYSWLDSMTEITKKFDNVLIIEEVYSNGCFALQGYEYSWPPACFDLVVEETVKPKANPHNIPQYRKDLLKALLEGETIQFKHGNGWLDCMYPLDSIESSKEDSIRVKPPEPVVTYEYKIVMKDGYVGDVNTKTVKELVEYYSNPEAKYILKKTFQNSLFVKMEVLDYEKQKDSE